MNYTVADEIWDIDDQLMSYGGIYQVTVQQKAVNKFVEIYFNRNRTVNIGI